ncbi:hypothetical protein K8R14_03575 [bacterium]|nr:hypothetical protein [bacterium]
MTYLFLPGNAISNKDWINNLSNEFDLPKEVIHYNHWDTEEEISFDVELQKL